MQQTIRGRLWSASLSLFAWIRVFDPWGLTGIKGVIDGVDGLVEEGEKAILYHCRLLSFVDRNYGLSAPFPLLRSND